MKMITISLAMTCVLSFSCKNTNSDVEIIRHEDLIEKQIEISDIKTYEGTLLGVKRF